MSEEFKNKAMEFFDEEEEKNKPNKAMVFAEPSKSVEDKIFIVLIYGLYSEDLFDGNYKICNGRTEAYRFIETLVQSYGSDFDPHISKVITETLQTETESRDLNYFLTNYFSSLSVYAFCKAVENYYTDDKFRIDDYFAAPDGNIDPIRDIETINLELALADLETVTNRINRISKKARMSKDKDELLEYETLEKLRKALEENTPIRLLTLTKEEKSIIKSFNFSIFKARLSRSALSSAINPSQ